MDAQLSCIKEREENYTYDTQKRIATRTDYLFDQSGDITMEWNYQYFYYGISDRLKRQIIESRNNPEEDVTISTIKYDDEGRLINEFYQRTDAEGNQSTVETRGTYNSDGCVAYFEVEKYNDIIGPEYSFLRVENTYLEDCLPESVRSYEFNVLTNTIELKSLVRWEYDKDSKGNNTRIFEYVNVAPWDSTLYLYSTSNIAYDEQGRDTLRVLFIHNLSLGQKHTTYYDQAGNEIYRLFEKWDDNNGSWIPVEEKTKKFNENDLLTYHLTQTNYDPSSHAYFYVEEYRIEYNKEGQEIYTYAQIDNYNPDFPYHEIYETHTDYACDGRYLKSEQTQQSNNKTRITTRFYFDRPLCEPNSQETLSITALPNPASRVVHIQTDQIIHQGVLSVYNEQGQLLFSQEVGTGSFYSLDVSTLFPGIYVIRMETQEKTALQKLVKGN
jgi:hypothetical protein